MKVILIIFLISIFPYRALASESGIVINEVQLAGEKSDDEFIKIFNGSGREIDLTGWKLAKVTLSGKSYNLLSSVPETKIGSGSYLSIGPKEFSGQKDLSYSTSNTIANDNTIILYDASGKVVDKVAFGSNTYGEGSAAPNPAPDNTAVRKTPGYDTDNNFVDFSKEAVLVDGNDNGNLSGIFINELMPDPASPKSDTSDEWIELYNSTEIRVSLGGAVLRDKSGVVRQYIIPEDLFIDPKNFAVFYSSATKITLNNDGDEVELLDKNGNMIDVTSDYGKTETGQSFALFGDEWDWTLSPTPLKENVLEQELDSEKKASTDTAKKGAAKKSSSSGKTTKKSTSSPKGSKKNVLGSKTLASGDSLGSDAETALSKIDNKKTGEFLLLLAGAISIIYIIKRQKIYEYFEQKSEGNI